MHNNLICAIFIAYICRSEAILLNLGYTHHSYCVPCQRRMGQEEMWYEGLFQGGKKKIQSAQTKWHRVPEGPCLQGLMQHISQDVRNSGRLSCGWNVVEPPPQLS